MYFLYWVGKSLEYYSVRTSYNLDIEFAFIIGWPQNQISSLEFEIINIIRVYLWLDLIKGIIAESFKMPSGQNKMDNKSDDQLFIIQATIKSKSQDFDDKVGNIKEEIIAMITSMMNQLKIINTQHTRIVHQRLRILPLWSRVTRALHHCMVDIIQKFVTCGI